MKKTLALSLLLILLMTFSATATPVTFYDLSDYGWATGAICRLAEKGVIKGVAPHYYAPANYVSKADLATLLGRMFSTGGNGLTAFPDVPADSYYYESVASLKALGILTSADGLFHPGDAVTREETMRWIGFLLKRFGFAETTDLSCLERFGDKGLISEENSEYAAILVNGGYITGDNLGNLNPRGYRTRAEIAVILDRLYTNLLQE